MTDLNNNKKFDFEKRRKGEKLDLENQWTAGLVDLLEYLKDHPEITYLNLYQYKLGPQGAKIFAESPYIKNIKHLDLTSSYLANEGVKYIIQSPYLQNLTYLKLSLNDITDRGIQAFAESNLSQLEHLVLSCNSFGLQGTKVLAAASANWNKLKILHLEYCEMGDEAVSALIDSGIFAQLTELNIAKNNLTDQTIIKLASSDLHNLTHLNLGDNKITDEGVIALASNPNIQKLTNLDLRNNKIGDKGTIALATSSNFLNLNILYLAENNIGDAGAKALASACTTILANLQTLDLGKNNIDIDGVEALYENTPKYLKLDLKDQTSDLACRYAELHQYIRDNINNPDLINKIACIMLWQVAGYDDHGIVLKRILTKSEDYHSIVNYVDIVQKASIADNYTHLPDIQRYLFNLGMIPNPICKNKDKLLQDIASNAQSVHNSEIVKKTNFIMQELASLLLSSNTASVDDEMQALDKYAEHYKDLLASLFVGDSNNSHELNDLNAIKILLLDLTSQEKLSVLRNNDAYNRITYSALPNNDHDFIKLVKEKALHALEHKYLRKNDHGQYDIGFPSDSIQYDWSKGGEKYTTIPKSIGLVISLIDKIIISLQEKQELCATLLQQCPELVSNKLQIINTMMQTFAHGNITLEQLSNKSEIYKLISQLGDQQLSLLFTEVSGLDLELTWKEQQYFKLAKQIYVAANTYGENQSACLLGTWTQIIDSAIEINPLLLDNYTTYLEDIKKQESKKRYITETNIEEFTGHAIKKIALDKEITENDALKDELIGFAVGSIDITNPNNITMPQQKVLAKVNQQFSSHVQEYLPEYEERIPTPLEYQHMINAIPRSKEAPIVVRMLDPNALIESTESFHESSLDSVQDHHEMPCSSASYNQSGKQDQSYLMPKSAEHSFTHYIDSANNSSDVLLTGVNQDDLSFERGL